MKIGQWVHLSVDDVSGCFKWIFQEEPESIFEEPMLAGLKAWHERYNLRCDLYVFEIKNGFNLAQLQEKYWTQLAQETSWLKLGWHRRISGPLTDGIETEIASFDRVYDLITQKGDKKLWTKTLRLHRWEASEELLEHMKGKHAVKCLLTADSDRLSYDLTEEIFPGLQTNGFLNKNKAEYRVTDLRLDYLAEDMTVELCLEKLQDCIENKQKKKKIEIFFHEVKWPLIHEKAEQLWERFGELEYPLLFDATVLVGEWMYFTTLNTDYLYRRNLNSGEVETVTKLPCLTHGISKFSALLYYKENLWMFPRKEENGYIYSLETGNIERIPSIVKGGFKQCLLVDNVVWMLPRTAHCIIKFNLEEQAVEVINQWPEGIVFPSVMRKAFYYMREYRDGIYLFRQESNYNIRINKEIGKMEVWDEETYGCNGTILEENTVILASLHLKKRINESIENKGQILSIPDETWEELVADEKVFLKQQCYRDVTYLLPVKSYALAYKSANSAKVGYVTLLNDRQAENSFTASNMILYNKQYSLPGFNDDRIIVMNEKIEEIKIERCRVRVENINKQNSEDNPENLLYEMRSLAARDWRFVQNIRTENITTGSVIYNAIKKE